MNVTHLLIRAPVLAALLALVASCDDGPENPTPEFDAVISHNADRNRAPHGSALRLSGFAEGYDGQIACRWSFDGAYADDPSLLGVDERDMLRCDLRVTLPDVEPGTEGTPATLPAPISFTVEISATGTDVVRSALETIEVTNGAPSLELRLDPGGTRLDAEDEILLTPTDARTVNAAESTDPEGDSLTISVENEESLVPCEQALYLRRAGDRFDLYLRPAETEAERCPLPLSVTDPYGAADEKTVTLVLDDTGAASARPNVVLITVNDLDPYDLGSAGNPVIETPNLDGLVDQGTSMTNAYAFPVDAPSRAALLTGRHPSRFGLRGPLDATVSMRGIPPEETTLPELLAGQGYQTAEIGYWALGSLRASARPSAQGFDEYAIFQAPTYSDAILENETGGELFTVGHSSSNLTDLAVSFIERNATNPFFLEVDYLAVAAPVVAPPEWVDHYADLELSDAAREYAAMVSAVDEQIGRILESLETSGLTERTIVIVTSDDGGRRYEGIHDADPLAGERATLLEGGVRVPLVIRWPGRVAAGVAIDTVTTSMDVAPTLGELAGLELTGLPFDGRSLVSSWLFGRAEQAPGTLCWELRAGDGVVPRDSGMTLDAAVLDGDDHLIMRAGEEPTSDSIELYDLAEDPEESQDLAESRPERVAELMNLYQSWRLSTTLIPVEVLDSLGDVTVEDSHIQFDGPGSVTLTRSSLIGAYDGDITFTAIVELTAVSTERRTIAHQPDVWSLALEPDGHLSLTVTRVEAPPLTLRSTATLPRLERHRISVVFVSGLSDGEGGTATSVRLMVDGSTDAARLDTAQISYSDASVVLGSANEAFEQPFIGALDEVAFYAAGLIPADIAALPAP